MNQKTDVELVTAIKNGNILAFETLVKEYQQPLFRYVMRIIRNEADAREIVQDSLFKIYKTIDRIDTTKKITSYIFAVTKNNTISHLRKRKIEIRLSESFVADEDETIFEHLVSEEDSLLIKGAVEKLADKYRQVIDLYYFDNLAYEEISQHTGYPINTVRTLLRRAKIQLKKIINYETD
jgi:RNA polymerase sigma-70 factor, ECF subfamily